MGRFFCVFRVLLNTFVNFVQFCICSFAQASQAGACHAGSNAKQSMYILIVTSGRKGGGFASQSGGVLLFQWMLCEKIIIRGNVF